VDITVAVYIGPSLEVDRPASAASSYVCPVDD
jgi:hypothetical protein